MALLPQNFRQSFTQGRIGPLLCCGLGVRPWQPFDSNEPRCLLMRNGVLHIESARSLLSKREPV
ncbi:hypothetical protein PWG14_07680, partial (plasmid) [Chromobacterium amazonense]|uniref:hypothetical protein n=1 Tax=Chromobacterium amazonense TaxID=1382803 RepID=UPI00237E9326